MAQMKVRSSEIDEPEVQNRINDVSDDDDSVVKYKRPMLHLTDFGIMLGLYEIASVEKDRQFTESQWGGGCRWQYGIIINKGIEKSQKYPKVNVSIWFESEEVRDKRYDDLYAALEEAGIIFINC